MLLQAHSLVVFLHPNASKQQSRDTAHRLEPATRIKKKKKLQEEAKKINSVLFLNYCSGGPVAKFFFGGVGLWGHARPPCYCMTQSVRSLSGCPCCLGDPFVADAIVLTARRASQTKLDRDNFL